MPRPRRTLPWLEPRDGVYYVHWYSSARRRTERLSLRTANPHEAAERFAAFLVQGRDIYAGDGPPRLSVADALDAYDAEHVGDRVIAKERTRLGIRHLKAHFAGAAVADIDIPAARAYAAERRCGRIGQPAAAGTIRRELGILIAAINHAVKWKRLPRDQAPYVEQPRAAAPKPRWLTYDELNRLREHARGRTRDFIDIAYYTASRRRAVERLTWFQVDLAAARIALALPGERVTKKRRPVVPIDPELLPLLQRLHAAKTSEFVLGSPGSVRKGFDAACRRAGLADVTPHTLRHTRATHLLQAGVSLWAVAGLLGDTAATVERVYGHHSPGYLEEVLRKGSADA